MSPRSGKNLLKTILVLSHCLIQYTGGGSTTKPLIPQRRGRQLEIDAKGLKYRELNEKIRQAVTGGIREIHLTRVNGQRFIGAGVSGAVRFSIEGVPCNDMHAFMDGPTITVSDNAQDGVGNTMNSAKVVAYGT